jgi:hypothetical protein
VLPPPEVLAPPPRSACEHGGPIDALVQASSPGPHCPWLVSAPAKLLPVDAPLTLRSDPVKSFGFPLSQYGSNFCLIGLESPTLTFEPRPQTQSSGGVGEDSSSVGMEVVPPSSP